MSAAGLIAFLRRRYPAASSDAELLRAYADRNDAEAFRVLLERHGPVVLKVCQRRLRARRARRAIWAQARAPLDELIRLTKLLQAVTLLGGRSRQTAAGAGKG